MTIFVPWHPQFAFQSRAPLEGTFYHDLLCRSGFGDRILDLCGALTVARLLDPKARVAFRWDLKGVRLPAFHTSYALELFSFAGAVPLATPPKGALVPLIKRFDIRGKPVRTSIRPLSGGGRQIILNRGDMWGNASPSRLHDQRAAYGLDHRGAADFAEMYAAVMRSLQPGQSVERALPDDLGGRVGVHARLTDKISGRVNDFEMTAESWARIEARTLAEIDQMVTSGHRFFVCADDTAYRDRLAEDLRAKGADVITAPIVQGAPGFPDLLDFFALSRCSQIVQLTKYSTFSIAAALVGSAALRNFSREVDPDGSGNRNDIWDSAFDCRA